MSGNGRFVYHLKMNQYKSLYSLNEGEIVYGHLNKMKKMTMFNTIHHLKIPQMAKVVLVEVFQYNSPH